MTLAPIRRTIIAARLDSLPANERSLLVDASVAGRVFWSGALAAMNGLQRWTVEESLHRLERKEFVRRERRSSIQGALKPASSSWEVSAAVRRAARVAGA